MNTDKWKLKQTGMFFSVFERGLFQGSDSSFSKGLFDADTNILLSFFTCKLIGDFFEKNVSLISTFTIGEDCPTLFLR